MFETLQILNSWFSEVHLEGKEEESALTVMVDEHSLCTRLCACPYGTPLSPLSSLWHKGKATPSIHSRSQGSWSLPLPQSYKRWCRSLTRLRFVTFSMLSSQILPILDLLVHGFRSKEGRNNVTPFIFIEKI